MIDEVNGTDQSPGPYVLCPIKPTKHVSGKVNTIMPTVVHGLEFSRHVPSSSIKIWIWGILRPSGLILWVLPEYIFLLGTDVIGCWRLRVRGVRVFGWMDCMTNGGFPAGTAAIWSMLFISVSGSNIVADWSILKWAFCLRSSSMAVLLVIKLQVHEPRPWARQSNLY